MSCRIQAAGDTRRSATAGRDFSAYWARWGCATSCLPCDTNCDGSVNGLDVDPFVELITVGGSPCSPCAGDVNGDGTVNPAL